MLINSIYLISQNQYLHSKTPIKTNKIFAPTFRGNMPINTSKLFSEEVLEMVLAGNAVKGVAFSKISEINENLKKEAIKMLANGESFQKIAKICECNTDTIKNFISLLPKDIKTKINNFNRRNRSSKHISLEQKDKIVERFANGESPNIIAKDYDKCCETTIRSIVNIPSESKEIQEMHKNNKQKLKEHMKSVNVRFSSEEIADIVERYKNYESPEEIAFDYHCSPVTIRKCINIQPDAEEIKKIHKENLIAYKREEQIRFHKMFSSDGFFR